jgi:large subunit ribosomal protein L32e
MEIKLLLKRDAKRFSKFGKGRDKRAKWRRPTGRDNKMREKRKGYDAVVSLGYSKDKATRGKFEDKTPIEIFNVYELQSLKEDEIGVLGSVGMKKKLEVAKYAKENKIKLKNLNAEAFLKKYEKAKKKEKKE